jgi:phosphotransferase system HPr (HPr) family protein
MYSRAVTLGNDTGLHVRPATLFMETASRFKSTIRVRKGGQAADGKSAISLMLLEAERGAALTIEATGEDEVAAADALADLVESLFTEHPTGS